MLSEIVGVLYIHELKTGVNSVGFAIIKNLPIGEVDVTPDSDIEYFNRTNRDRLSETILVGVGELLGVIFSYCNEKQGILVNNIVPRENSKNIQSSNGSSLVLPLHTEDCHQFPYAPDFIVLFCLKGEVGEGVFTNILNPRNIINSIPSNVIDILCQPLFLTTPPPVYGGRNNRIPQPKPILYGWNPEWQVMVEFNDTKGINHESNEALEAFKTACLESDDLYRLHLQQGDMVILDNNKLMHGRGGFLHRSVLSVAGFNVLR